MTRFMLIVIAALSIASTVARAEPEDEQKWQTSFRRCEINKVFLKGDENVYEGIGWQRITITLDDVADIKRALVVLEKCKKFWSCVNDRDAGKVKHCYENDKRWRMQ